MPSRPTRTLNEKYAGILLPPRVTQFKLLEQEMTDGLLFFLLGLILSAILFQICIAVFSFYKQILLSIERISARNKNIYDSPIIALKSALVLLSGTVLTIALLRAAQNYSADIEYIITTLSLGKFADPWTEIARSYGRLTDKTHQLLILGLIAGFLLALLANLILSDKTGEGKRQNRFALSISLGMTVVLGVIAPYLDRFFLRTTSLEFAQAKVTFSSPQASSSESKFSAGPLSTGSQDYKPNDIRVPLRLLGTLTQDEDGDQCKGIIERDLIYQGITAQASPILPAFRDAIDADKEMFKAISFIPRCLSDYAVNFSDYRLLLVDIKPIITSLTSIVRQTGEGNNSKKSSQLARDLLDKLSDIVDRAQSLLRIVKASDGSSINCFVAKHQIRVLKESIGNGTIESRLLNNFSDNVSPYKTLALSYILSAVGAYDKGSLEIDKWLLQNKDKNIIPRWYFVRMKIEQSIMLINILPGGEQHPVYKKFVPDYIDLFSQTFENHDLKKWSESCRHQSYLNKALMGSYVAAVNGYVKAFADLEGVDFKIIEKASQIKDVDFSCFDDVAGFSGETDSWKANILTSNATALLAASYSNRMYARSKSKREELQSQARLYLVEAVDLFRKEKDRYLLDKKTQSTKPINSCNSDEYWTEQGESTLFNRWSWSERESFAKNLLLRSAENLE